MSALSQLFSDQFKGLKLKDKAYLKNMVVSFSNRIISILLTMFTIQLNVTAENSISFLTYSLHQQRFSNLHVPIDKQYSLTDIK